MNEWNKRAVFFFAILILISIHSQKASAQAIYWENGLSFSKLGKLDTKSSYFTRAGVQYVNHDYFFLSSAIGLLHKGDEISYHFSELGSVSGKTSDKYLTLNTVFNIKKTFQNLDLYAGVGPEINFYLKNDKSELEKIFMQSTVLSLDCTVGMKYRLDCLVAGVAFHYLPSLTHVYKGGSLKDKTFAIGLSAGYIF